MCASAGTVGPDEPLGLCSVTTLLVLDEGKWAWLETIAEVLGTNTAWANGEQSELADNPPASSCGALSGSMVLGEKRMHKSLIIAWTGHSPLSPVEGTCWHSIGIFCSHSMQIDPGLVFPKPGRFCLPAPVLAPTRDSLIGTCSLYPPVYCGDVLGLQGYFVERDPLPQLLCLLRERS